MATNNTNDNTTAQRLAALLAGNTTRAYLTDVPAEPRLAVVCYDDVRRLIYGDYEDGAGPFEGTWVPLEWVLEAAENGDSEPQDWEYEWDLVAVRADNAVGFTHVTRSNLCG